MSLQNNNICIHFELYFITNAFYQNIRITFKILFKEREFIMDVIARINEIMKQQGLTTYQLSKKSGLSQSTLANMNTRNTTPTIPTLESICDSLNMSLCQFFADDSTDFYPVNGQQREMLDLFIRLDDDQQEAILNLLRTIRPEKGKADSPDEKRK